MEIFFDQQVGNDLKTTDNIQKNAAGQRNDYTTGCMSDYSYIKESCKLIAFG